MMMMVIGGMLLLRLMKVMMVLLMLLMLLVTPLRGPVRSLVPSTAVESPVPAESCCHAAVVVAPCAVNDRGGPGLLGRVKGARAHREALMLVDTVVSVVVVPGQRHRVRAGAATVADGVFHERVHVGAAGTEQERRKGPANQVHTTNLGVRARQQHSSMDYSSRDGKDLMIKKKEMQFFALKKKNKLIKNDALGGK